MADFLDEEGIEMFSKMPYEKFSRWINFWDNHLWWMVPGFLICFILTDGWQGQLFIVIFAIQGTIKQVLAWDYLHHRQREFRESQEKLKKK